MAFKEDLIDLLELPNKDLVPFMNGTVYASISGIAGAPLWKIFLVWLFVFCATRFHYGRKTLTRIGIISAIVGMPLWLELIDRNDVKTFLQDLRSSHVVNAISAR